MEKLKKAEMYEEDEDFPKDEEVSTSIMWVRFGDIYQAFLCYPSFGIRQENQFQRDGTHPIPHNLSFNQIPQNLQSLFLGGVLVVRGSGL